MRRFHPAWTFPILVVAAPALADDLYLLNDATGELHRYDLQPAGAPAHLQTITDSSFVRPAGLALRRTGDVLVMSRGPCTACSGGGLTVLDAACGTIGARRGTAQTGWINPHGIMVVGDTAYCVDSYGDRLRKFTFDASDAPVDAGSITAGYPADNGRYITFHPGLGEILMSACCGTNSVVRWILNPDGTATPNGQITGNGINNPHGVVVSPSGELFVCNINSASVSRFTFNAGVAVPNGIITGNSISSPLSILFTPWGELLVQGNTGVSRFLFDQAGNAVPNGVFVPGYPPAAMTLSTGTPTVVRSPSDAWACPGGELVLGVLGVGANASAPFSYQWRHNGQPLPGQTEATLVVSGLDAAKTGAYDCVLTNPCDGRSSTSDAANVTICTADFNCDGVVDFFDYLDFASAFDVEDASADFNGDQSVDFFDYLDFAAAFDAGC